MIAEAKEDVYSVVELSVFCERVASRRGSERKSVCLSK